jgi:hypothetical protein
MRFASLIFMPVLLSQIGCFSRDEVWKRNKLFSEVDLHDPNHWKEVFRQFDVIAERIAAQARPFLGCDSSAVDLWSRSEQPQVPKMVSNIKASTVLFTSRLSDFGSDLFDRFHARLSEGTLLSYDIFAIVCKKGVSVEKCRHAVSQIQRQVLLGAGDESVISEIGHEELVDRRDKYQFFFRTLLNLATQHSIMFVLAAFTNSSPITLQRSSKDFPNWAVSASCL